MQQSHNSGFYVKADNNISILLGKRKFIASFAKSRKPDPTMRQLDLSRNFSKISHSVINQKGEHFGMKVYGGMNPVQLASK